MRIYMYIYIYVSLSHYWSAIMRIFAMVHLSWFKRLGAADWLVQGASGLRHRVMRIE